MARPASPVAFLATAVLLALAPAQVDAQRPALAGEKARVAEAVKRDLTRLAALQRTYLGRAKTFATDPKDLNYTPTSGAEVSIAFASANAWAANASHPALSPVKCFVIISASDAVDAPTSQPFCTDAEPGTAAGRVADAGKQPVDTPTKAVANTTSVTPIRTPAPRPSAPATRRPAPTRATTPATTPASTPATTPASAPNTPSRARVVAPAATPAAASTARETNAGIRMITRDAGETSTADRVESVSPTEFTTILNGMARDAIAVMDAPPPQVRRDPYESTPEFEARRAAAMAEYQAREAEYFRTTKRSFVVSLPVRNVRYDADTEMLEFNVDGFRLPTTREGRSQLTVACFTRPVFWCMPDSGMTYDANDLWKVPRATARQFDVLRTPLTLTARFTVGGRPEGERALAISLVDMELQARGQVVQRWAGR
ncbi:MAG: hypothetical protein IPJ78_11390 [Gemmatimonadetes bacterium]|nr:hypothetical protein [Gemmatimonadota bacterium]